MLARYRSSVVVYFSLLAILFLFSLILIGCAAPVIKMPKPMPDIVKEYKSFRLYATIPHWVHTGIYVKEGDYFTIMAKGEIYREGVNVGVDPYWKILWKIGDKGFPWLYTPRSQFNSHKSKENGEIWLRCNTEGSVGYSGFFDADIILWKKEDPIQVASFLEEMSLRDPTNRTLKEFLEDFREQKEILLAEKKAKEEVEEVKQAITALEKKEVSAIKEPDKEKQIAGLNERLQKAMLSLKELDELKKKLKEEEEKKEELAARLEQMEKEKLHQNLPFIAIASPRDGVSVGDEYVYLLGVAEHEKGIAQFEILVNNEATKKVDQRGLKLVAKEAKRIEFSERIRLREGKNNISVVAQDFDGLIGKKNISVNLIKKQKEVWAAVIGINKYKNLPSLKYSVNDAREFHRYLVEVNQIPKENVWLLLDEEATLDKVRSVLGTQLRRKAGKEDMVIIYLAGHGATERDAASPDGDGLEKYILPHNADPKDLYASAMPMSEVARIFNRISSERLVFISDTCYSGGSGGRTVPVLGVRASISATHLDRLSQGKGRVILTASDANEVSVEKDELKHGVFTYYLLEGLRGKADLDGDGMITVDEIYRYVYMKVSQATGQDQHPVKKGEMTGQIVLGVVK